jgi:hypothetical protein
LRNVPTWCASALPYLVQETIDMASKKLQAIHKDLQSEDPNKVYAALKDLRKEGTRESIPLVIEVLTSDMGDVIDKEVLDILGNLKDKNTVAFFIDALEDPKNEDVRKNLLQAIWSADLKIDEHLSYFVNLALNSDYLTAFECYTVIEQASFDDDTEALNLIGDLREAQMRQHENSEVLELLVQSLNDKIIG